MDCCASCLGVKRFGLEWKGLALALGVRYASISGSEFGGAPLRVECSGTVGAFEALSGDGVVFLRPFCPLVNTSSTTGLPRLWHTHTVDRYLCKLFSLLCWRRRLASTRLPLLASRLVMLVFCGVVGMTLQPAVDTASRAPTILPRFASLRSDQCGHGEALCFTE